MLEAKSHRLDSDASQQIRMSTLPHTWLIDIDGTALRHNGHLPVADGCKPPYPADQILPGVYDFWLRIPPEDVIILMSARSHEEKNETLEVFNILGLIFDHAIFGLPTGERILINDSKTSGLNTAVAMNVARDAGLGHISILFDENL